jgi:hypothetical protein
MFGRKWTSCVHTTSCLRGPIPMVYQKGCPCFLLILVHSDWQFIPSNLCLLVSCFDLFETFTFPDGLDIAGQRIIVRNCRIQNFDDSVAIKPLNGGDQMARVQLSTFWSPTTQISCSISSSTSVIPFRMTKRSS